MANEKPSKIQTWQKQIKAWRKSGESVSSFCRTQRLSEPSLYAWRRRLADVGGSPNPTASTRMFVPATVVPEVDGVMELALPDGKILRMRGANTVERMIAVIKALEAAGC